MSRLRTEVEAILGVLTRLPDDLADVVMTELGGDMNVMAIAPLMATIWARLSPNAESLANFRVMRVPSYIEVFHSPLPYEGHGFQSYDDDEAVRPLTRIAVEEITLHPIHMRNGRQHRNVVIHIGAGKRSGVMPFWTEDWDPRG